MRPWIEVSKLCVTTDSGSAIVSDVSFSLAKGEVLALIGESGSGKTTVALALLGYARPGLRIASGTVRVGETELAQLPALRGTRIAYIAQSAAAAFNPSLTILDQVIEAALVHGVMDRATATAKAIELFRALALPLPETIGARYPHQLSGGQLQRAMAAMAFITDPDLVILDEPTTALDVTTQAEVLQLFKQVVKQRGTTAVYVSHDLAVVAQMADRIAVLNRGEVREQGTTAAIIDAPGDDYTRQLIAAAEPKARGFAAPPDEAVPLIAANHLSAGYGGRAVLSDVSFAMQRGGMLGVIGESGSGKSTLARVIAGLVPATSGDVRLAGERLPPALAERSREQLRRVQIVFQNASTALNPAHRVSQILARPLALYHGMTGDAAARRVGELLDMVQLPGTVAASRPAELSGGQIQRVNLARALAAEPELVLCDEVTSALDTVVGAAILDLLVELRRDLNLAILFISHDISTVRAICDEIMVLYQGRVVEQVRAAAFDGADHHPYTDLLLSAVPELRAGWLEERELARR
jgi:peptide/nickel transport system ATP-binding protein